MKRYTFGVAIIWAGLWACGDAGQVDKAGQTAEEIVGGTIDNGHPSVVEINFDLQDIFGKTYSKASSCSGTLVSSSVIVSAAHCLFAKDSLGLDLKVTAARAYFGSDAASATDAQFRPIKEWHAHPSYDRTVASPNDIAVLILASPEQSIAPMPLNTTTLSSDSVGKPITSVGFGKTKSTDGFSLGQKRSVTTKVVSLDSDGKHISYGQEGATTCQGDSGGPELMSLGGKETLVGVTSYGPSPCESGPATAVRVDAHLDFLNKYLGASTPAPPQDGGGGGTTPPPSGDGGTTSYSCCVDGTCYSCPTKAALDKCVGFDLGACLNACGSNFACFAECQAKANASPKDPSGCTKQ
jgi:secreted trypsin-like serine protease